MSERVLTVNNITYDRVRAGAYVIRPVPKKWKVTIDCQFKIVCEKNDILIPVIVRYVCNCDGYLQAGFIRTL